MAQASKGTGFVAGESWKKNDFTWEGTTITIPLYRPGATAKWTGNGAYDIFIPFVTDIDGNSPFYTAKNVDFNTATVTVDFTQFTVAN